MIQKEVADRICADAGSADYGAFSVYVRYYTEPEMLFTVEKESFIPQPKVRSPVVRLKIRENPCVTLNIKVCNSTQKIDQFNKQ